MTKRFYLFTGDIIVCVENPKKPIKILQSELSKIAGQKINVKEKSTACVYSSNEIWTQTF